jgi:hypothetical protein
MDVDDNEDKTMLGEEQLSWLLNGLNQSTAPFKLILSSVSMNDYGGDTSSGREGYDSWMGYTFERNTILSFIEDNQIYGVLVFSGDQHYPSGYILNWNTPLNSVSQTDSSIVYSLSDLGLVVFDFSSSPLHYNRATGHALIPGNQNNPFYSFEIFRAELGHPSVYGLVEVDTENFTKSVAVTFYELDSENELMIRLYGITVIRDSLTAVISQSIEIPSYFLIKQNYPNPFNPTTTIEFNLASDALISLVLYDVTGREVMNLVDRNLDAGHYSFGLNASDLPSGMYFYKLSAQDSQNHLMFTSTKKLVLMK